MDGRIVSVPSSLSLGVFWGVSRLAMLRGVRHARISSPPGTNSAKKWWRKKLRWLPWISMNTHLSRAVSEYRSCPRSISKRTESIESAAGMTVGLFSVRDGVFRQFNGERSLKGLKNYIEFQEWQRTAPVSSYLAPDSIPWVHRHRLSNGFSTLSLSCLSRMSIVGSIFDISLLVRVCFLRCWSKWRDESLLCRFRMRTPFWKISTDGQPGWFTLPWLSRWLPWAWFSDLYAWRSRCSSFSFSFSSGCSDAHRLLFDRIVQSWPSRYPRWLPRWRRYREFTAEKRICRSKDNARV